MKSSSLDCPTRHRHRNSSYRYQALRSPSLPSPSLIRPSPPLRSSNLSCALKLQWQSIPAKNPTASFLNANIPATVMNMTAHRLFLSSSVNSPPFPPSSPRLLKSLDRAVFKLSPTPTSSSPAAITRTHRRTLGKPLKIARATLLAKRPRRSLSKPRNMMLAPERAPKRYSTHILGSVLLLQDR